MNRLLERLVSEAVAEMEVRRHETSAAELERRAAKRGMGRGFAAALKRPTLAVIAEMKASTPLQGRLCEAYDPRSLAAAYSQGGAAALSVLAQRTSFGGSPDHLLEARTASDLPIMRKDFVVDEYQVVEARAFDADACLLIAGALTSQRLCSLLRCAREVGVDVLVETHSRDEVETALAAGARLIGVNHRDLNTFEVDLSLTGTLREIIPKEFVLVSESGIRNTNQVRELRRAGADAVLVGEALMRASDPARLIAEWSAI
jgi:indole-3-glycerol phosphate synthase